VSSRTAFERLRADPRFEALRLDTVRRQDEARSRVEAGIRAAVICEDCGKPGAGKPRGGTEHVLCARCWQAK